MRSPILLFRSAAPVILLAGLAAISLGGFAGCASSSKKTVEPAGPRIGPPAQAVIGRVVSVDLQGGLAVVRLVPQPDLPLFFENLPLVSRGDDLRPTAKLTGSRQRQGNIIGTYIAAGRPRVEDEVILELKPKDDSFASPASPPPPRPAPPRPPAPVPPPVRAYPADMPVSIAVPVPLPPPEPEPPPSAAPAGDRR
ncbi:hypothetical protein OpiT1DRAFT_05214 [Opitutaceae bacterium TAV1]|nr:hypothetical protein OpiT1DRAFT_05214 [Opitutaceae bacterium TAV1]